MLSVDIPEEFKDYKGMNPCPVDFDKYWDESVEEMHSIATEIEFVPCKYNFRNVEAYDIWFTGVGGARIHGKCVKPGNLNKPVPAVLMFHGYGGAGDDFPTIMFWAAQGYVAISLDVRGQSGLSEDIGVVKGHTQHGHIIRGLDDEDPKKLFMRSAFLDCAELAYLTMKLDFVDKDNVFIMGGSQGGGLSTACAALEPRVKKAAITFPFLSDYKKIWYMDLYVGAYEELGWYFRTKDYHHERQEEIWTKLGYIDVHNLASRIKAEVLMNVGLKDTICPPITQFAVYNNIKSKKRCCFWHDFGHEPLYGEWNEISDFFAEGLE